MCEETIQVSSQPVAPSFGIEILDRRAVAWSVFVWYGHGGADHRVAVLEQVDLVRGERPVLLDQRPLLLEQRDRRVELGLGQLVRDR